MQLKWINLGFTNFHLDHALQGHDIADQNESLLLVYRVRPFAASLFLPIRRLTFSPDL